MALIYRSSCSACGRVETWSNTVVVVRTDDGREEIQPDPADVPFAVKTTGLSFFELQKAGRVRYETAACCNSCGWTGYLEPSKPPRPCLACGSARTRSLSAAVRGRRPAIYLGIVGILSMCVASGLVTTSARPTMSDHIGGLLFVLGLAAMVATIPLAIVEIRRQVAKRYVCPHCHARGVRIEAEDIPS